MSVARLLCVLALAAPLAGCFDPPPPPPPPPENVFVDPVDRALVKQAMIDTAANPAGLGVNRYQQLVISSDPRGKWRAVCGQASGDGVNWKDFVAIADEGVAITSLAIRGDQMTPARIPVCKRLVQTYLGERVSAATAETAFDDAGCGRFDETYWWAWKSYCTGTLTRPSPAPAQ